MSILQPIVKTYVHLSSRLEHYAIVSYSGAEAAGAHSLITPIATFLVIVGVGALIYEHFFAEA